MSERYEGHFRGGDDLELFFQVWPGNGSRGSVIITHGLAEHSDCYERLAQTLSQDGWEVFAWDLRGHGRSEGKRGFVKNFEDFYTDLEVFIQKVIKDRQAPSDSPLILFAHSLGGLITCNTLLRKPELKVTAVVFSSPLFGIAVEVPKLKAKIAEVAAQWLPSLTLHNEIQYTDLSRDEEMLRSYEQDPLRHDKISPVLYLGIVEGCSYVQIHAENWTLPVLFLLAGDDRIVSTVKSEQVYQLVKSSKKELHLYPDSLHEIFNDLDRDVALSDLKKFLGQFQMGSKS